MTTPKVLLFIAGLIQTLAVVGCFVYAEYSNNENIESFFDLWPVWGTALLIGCFMEIIVLYPLEKGDN